MKQENIALISSDVSLLVHLKSTCRPQNLKSVLIGQMLFGQCCIMSSAEMGFEQPS